jgi:hypothetical protein
LLRKRQAFSTFGSWRISANANKGTVVVRSRTNHTLTLIAAATVFCLLATAHFVFLRQGLCSAILDSGQPDCSSASRWRYFTQNLGWAGFILFMNFCLGTFFVVAWAAAKQRFRK